MLLVGRNRQSVGLDGDRIAVVGASDRLRSRPFNMRKSAVISALVLLSGMGLLPGPGRHQELAAQTPVPIPAEVPAAGNAGASNRQLISRCRRAKELIQDENYSESTRVLQSILETDDDFFFKPDETEDSPEKSIKAECQRMLGEMPAAGREAYEKQYGPVARRLLADALAQGDGELLSEVTRRFFHTKAGYEATYRLANDQLDHGHPLTAALSFERLRQTAQAASLYEPMLSLKAALSWRRAGRDDQALEVLAQLRERSPRKSVTLGGREVPLFEERSQALAWITEALGSRIEEQPLSTEWIMPRGDAQRNAGSAGGSPYLNRGWRRSTVEGSTISSEGDAIVAQTIADRFTAAMANEDHPTTVIPSLQPLAVDGKVIVRTIGDVRAYSLADGVLVWASSDKDQLLSQMLRTQTGPQAQILGTTPQALLIAQRTWGDSTFGTISSNGELVFAVEDLGLGGPLPFQMPRLNLTREHNRLVAYSVKTGKAIWEIGGPRSDDGDLLAGAFFVGAPLVLDQRLYCMAETGTETRLFVLNPQDGRIVWSQTLNEDPDLALDYTRRRYGLTPAYDGGVLVCPTGTSHATAVDLTSRSLVWRHGARTGDLPAGVRQQQAMLQQHQLQARLQATGGIDQNRWLDCTPIIDRSRVLLTPRDANELHCVNLTDGSVIWKLTRGDMLYVAGVHDGHAIVVGRTFVQALRMTDGHPIWPEPATVAAPSGRGFLAGDNLHLPLSTAEVATIELRTGGIVARSRSLAGRIPGNIVGLRGLVISQGADFVESFPQIETLETEITATLQSRPNDAAAMALRGEIRLQRGEFREAYRDLQRALELNSEDDQTRTLLADSLLEGLRVDFTTYRNLPIDFEHLFRTPEQKSDYLWLQATGLQRSGDNLAAFEALLRFADPSVSDFKQSRVDGTLSVRRDRLVRSRIARLYEDAAPQLRLRMDGAWRRRANELATSDASAISMFLRYYGDLFDVTDLKRSAAHLPPTGNWLEDEFLSLRLAESADLDTAASAVARAARVLVDSERPQDTRILLQKIEQNWPDTPAFDGKTGRELVAEWMKRPELARGSVSSAGWPTGQVLIERDLAVGNPTGNGAFKIPFEGTRAPFFGETTVEIGGNWQHFLARDALGQPAWRLNLEEQVQPVNYYLNRVWTRDHFLLVSMGAQILAIDTLGLADAPGPRLLWRMNLSDLPTIPAVVPNGLRAMRQRMPINQFGEPPGSIGPITRDSVILQKGRKLMAVEPMTGNQLWVRDGILPGAELTGDDAHLCIIPPDVNPATAGTAVVVRMLDGEIVGNRSLPPANVRLDSVGSSCLTWQSLAGRQELARFDIVGGKAIWKRGFAIDSLIATIDGDSAAVLEPEGRFVVVSLADGHVELEASVESFGTANQIFVRRSPDQYVLFCNEQLELGNLGQGQISPPHQSVFVHGNVHAFDRSSGKRLWTTRVDRQAYDPTQPAAMPILTFMTTVVYPGQRPNSVESRVCLTLIDKRTGRVLYDERRLEEPPLPIEYNVDREEREIEMKMMRSTLRLKFTDKPWPE